MDIGVFIPIGNNGWLISTTSPQYMPSFDLNREIVSRAEAYGIDFALAMVKLRGFGGPSRYWDYNLEPFTLIAGLAATTSTIKLYASVPILAVPPAIAARMAVTIDSIAPGRFGVNIVTGWQEAEYAQMGLWPGERHYAHRYDFATEYVEILRELWTTGRSNFAGEYFRYNDCQLLPRPSEVSVVCAGQSDRGIRFCAEQGDYNFVVSNGVNEPTAHEGTLARIRMAADHAGREVGAYVLVMVIADETDEAAFAKWRRYHDGIDTEALAWALGQTAPDPSSRTEGSSLHVMAKSVEEGMVNLGMGTVIGSFANVARMLDEMASLPGTSGVMLVMDDYLQGVEDFGTRIQPLMRSRAQHAIGATAKDRAASPAGPRTRRSV